MVKTNIKGLKLVKVDVGTKSFTGTILLADPQNDKITAKYRITHQCFPYGLQLLGKFVEVSYDGNNRIIDSIRPID